VALLPLWAFVWFVTELSGEGRWYRRQRQRMTAVRPPLPDAEFLAGQQIEESKAFLWVAVRRAVGTCCGVPAEAIYPHDNMKDLWRMQFLGPDAIDFVFRLEMATWVKVPMKTGSPIYAAIQQTLDSDFSRFSRAVVDTLQQVDAPWPPR
jgi:hypothetical protein